MFHTSYIELRKSALKKNIHFIRKKIGKKPIISSVVKGNAYGHGLSKFLPLAEECGIRHFSVFSAYEALKALKSKTEESEIMIMGIIDNEELEWAIENKISFYISDLDRLNASKETAIKIGIPAKIHLELETGLNRTGLQKSELEKVINIIKSNQKYLDVKGFCTHYAGAESIRNYYRIQHQITKFNKICDWFESYGIKNVKRHTACSAATLNYPETIMDMVRIGIVQYGFWPNKETKIHYFINHSSNENYKMINPLRRVLTWKSKIMNIKEVACGVFIGYGTSYQTSRPQKIASVPVGYSHGFSRNLSNLGRVLVKGRRAHVIGLVNMNMMTIDITDCKDVKKGDEVVIIGRQKNSSISVTSFSDLSNFLNYEALARISAEIPRKILN